MGKSHIPHIPARADKSEGGLALVDGLVRKVVANVAGDSDRTVLPTSSRFFLWHGMLTAVRHLYSLDLHNQLVTAHSPKNWKTQYIHIHLLLSILTENQPFAFH